MKDTHTKNTKHGYKIAGLLLVLWTITHLIPR